MGSFRIVFDSFLVGPVCCRSRLVVSPSPLLFGLSFCMFVLIFEVVSLVRSSVGFIPLGAFASCPWLRVRRIRRFISIRVFIVCACCIRFS